MGAARPVGRRRDARLLAIVGSAALIGLGGAGIAYRDALIGPRAEPQPLVDARVDPAGHVRTRKQAEFDARFQQAVVMLHAREYEHAAAALHRLLELSPEVPEVHVNMGYAMIGLKRYAAARDFFAGAIELRAGQANAYYGLALSLDATGDLPGALGAMRTYVHLTRADDPYAAKARASIEQWQARLGKKP